MEGEKNPAGRLIDEFYDPFGPITPRQSTPPPVVQLAGQVSRRAGIIKVSTRVKRDKLQPRRSGKTCALPPTEEEEEEEETTRSQKASRAEKAYGNASVGATESIYIPF